jgi:hypothetical protein
MQRNINVIFKNKLKISFQFISLKFNFQKAFSKKALTLLILINSLSTTYNEKLISLHSQM